MTCEIRREECGCVVQQLHDAEVYIIYCPLHKATPELYEACKEAVNCIELYPYGRDPVKVIKQLEQAIAKVEGG